MNSSQSLNSQPDSPANKWLTTTQVMELLDISRGTLYRLISEGKLELVSFKGNKILKHRRIRFSRETVEKLMVAYDYDCIVNNF